MRKLCRLRLSEQYEACEDAVPPRAPNKTDILMDIGFVFYHEACEDAVPPRVFLLNIGFLRFL